jgi:hypothetical protein
MFSYHTSELILQEELAAILSVQKTTMWNRDRAICDAAALRCAARNGDPLPQLAGRRNPVPYKLTYMLFCTVSLATVIATCAYLP